MRPTRFFFLLSVFRAAGSFRPVGGTPVSGQGTGVSRMAVDKAIPRASGRAEESSVLLRISRGS